MRFDGLRAVWAFVTWPFAADGLRLFRLILPWPAMAASAAVAMLLFVVLVNEWVTRAAVFSAAGLKDIAASAVSKDAKWAVVGDLEGRMEVRHVASGARVVVNAGVGPIRGPYIHSTPNGGANVLWTAPDGALKFVAVSLTEGRPRALEIKELIRADAHPARWMIAGEDPYGVARNVDGQGEFCRTFATIIDDHIFDDPPPGFRAEDTGICYGVHKFKTRFTTTVSAIGSIVNVGEYSPDIFAIGRSDGEVQLIVSGEGVLSISGWNQYFDDSSTDSGMCCNLGPRREPKSLVRSVQVLTGLEAWKAGIRHSSGEEQTRSTLFAAGLTVRAMHLDGTENWYVVEGGKTLSPAGQRWLNSATVFE